MKRAEAVKLFLDSMAVPDLASLYTRDMECQVLVKDHPDWLEGDGRGKLFRDPESGIAFYGFRIQDEEGADKEVKFPLEHYVRNVGLTGWDFKKKESIWVGIDFDIAEEHTSLRNAPTQDQLDLVINQAKEIPWLEIRRSTHGNGYHMYVYLPEGTATETRAEHIALTRYVMQAIESRLGVPFQQAVDSWGKVLWVWSLTQHAERGFQLVKKADTNFDSLPYNWRSHVEIQRSRKGDRAIIKTKDSKQVDEISKCMLQVDLDDDHKRLIAWLQKQQGIYTFDQDRNLVNTHTSLLKDAHRALGLLGAFDTASRGTNLAEQNCFMFPLRDGAWVVRRHGGSNISGENALWEREPGGYLKCYYNTPLTLKTYIRVYGGYEHVKKKGTYGITLDSYTASGLSALGVTTGKLPFGIDPNSARAKRHEALQAMFWGRELVLQMHPTDGRLVLTLPHREGDPEESMREAGWHVEGSRPKTWAKIEDLYVRESPTLVFEPMRRFEDRFRYIVRGGEFWAWFSMNDDSEWVKGEEKNVKHILELERVPKAQVKDVIRAGSAFPWYIVHRPFEEEYLSGRRWNKNAPSFIVDPSGKAYKDLNYPTWKMILDHVGHDLDFYIDSEKGWFKKAGIKKGGDYLFLWYASIFQNPYRPLPMIFLHGPQGCGKSTFYLMMWHLIDSGIKDASTALSSQGNFNGQLEGAVVCVMEEEGVKNRAIAYDKLKKWISDPKVEIHIKGLTPYTADNTWHWIQCANKKLYSPIFSGDTRVVAIEMQPFDKFITGEKLNPLLKQEAPDFLQALISRKIPPFEDRLGLPVIETDSKTEIMHSNEDAPVAFVREMMEPCAGNLIPYTVFKKRFFSSGHDMNTWTKQMLSSVLTNADPKIVKGKLTGNDVFIANLRWKNQWADGYDQNPTPEPCNFVYVREGYTLEERRFDD